MPTITLDETNPTGQVSGGGGLAEITLEETNPTLDSNFPDVRTDSATEIT